RSSPTVASAGGGRLQPRGALSSVSMLTVGPHVFPESEDDDAYKMAVLSLRTLHQAAWCKLAPWMVRTDEAQSPGAATNEAVDVAFETICGAPLESVPMPSVSLPPSATGSAH